MITVEDNGKGINRESVKATALKRGLIKPDEDLTDDAVYSLIFKNAFQQHRNYPRFQGVVWEWMS